MKPLEFQANTATVATETILWDAENSARPDNVLQMIGKCSLIDPDESQFKVKDAGASLSIPCAIRGTKVEIVVQVDLRYGPDKPLPPGFRVSLFDGRRYTAGNMCKVLSGAPESWELVCESASTTCFQCSITCELQSVDEQSHLPYEIRISNFYGKKAFIPINSNKPRPKEFRLVLVKLVALVVPDRCKHLEMDLMNAFLLPVGFLISHRTNQRDYYFMGHSINGSAGAPTKVAVLQDVSTRNLTCETLDPRGFVVKSVAPDGLGSIVDDRRYSWEYRQLDKLAQRCSDQRIRGVRLMDLRGHSRGRSE